MSLKHKSATVATAAAPNQIGNRPIVTPPAKHAGQRAPDIRPVNFYFCNVRPDRIKPSRGKNRFCNVPLAGSPLSLFFKLIDLYIFRPIFVLLDRLSQTSYKAATVLFGRKKTSDSDLQSRSLEVDSSSTRMAASSTDVPVNLDCAGRTDIGKKRQTNQDQFLIANLHKSMHVQQASTPFAESPLASETMGKMLFVADGVGGACAGEVASEMAIQTMAQYLLNSMHWLFHPKQPEIEKFISDLKSGAQQSHQAVCEDAQHHPEHRGMGSTLTFAYLMWPMMYVLHIGDSRCYVLREDSLQQITRDQTLAQQLMDCGQLSGSEFEQSPYHNVLLSAIGAESGADADVYKTRLLAGDRVMLCSDGINAHLKDDQIKKILASANTAQQICDAFVEETNRRGGRDNITVVVGIANESHT
jgi:protein phosphatase